MRLAGIAVLLLCALIPTKHALHMFQQNRYELTRYTAWLKQNIKVLWESMPVAVNICVLCTCGIENCAATRAKSRFFLGS